MITRYASCACGRVQCRAVGEPILSAVCYCDNCQEGARQIEALPNATSFRDADGGTPYLTYRARFEGDLPPLEMRTQTRYRRANTDLPHDVPSYRRFGIGLFAKLVTAR